MLGMGTFFTTKAYRQTRLFFGTNDWLVAPAKIIHRSDIKVDRTSKYPTAYLEVAYQYTVADKQYEGKTILDQESLTDVEMFRDENPVGREITIHYNPDDPAQSVYRQEFGSQTFLFLAVGLGGCVIFIGMTVYSVTNRKTTNETAQNVNNDPRISS